MEKLTLIIAVVTGILSLGVIGVVKIFIKELKDVVAKYKEAKADNVITEKEMKEIAQECMEAIEQGIKLGYIIKKAFKKK